MATVANGRIGCAMGFHTVSYAPMSTNEIELKSIRLLLVEDNPADARVVERHLKDAGLATVACDIVQTAGEAAERLQSVEYDLVLLDLGLPDATGLQALRALRAVADLTPIIVLTGSDDYKQGLVAVREGRIHAQGDPSRVVDERLLREVFGLECRVIEDPITGTPLCLPLTGARRRRDP